MSKAEHLQSLGSGETNYEYDEPDKSQLETFEYEADHLQMVTFLTDEFTSLCPKTGQPDFANMAIAYIPRNLGVESKSLKLYLFRYRNHGSFHEDCVAKIMTDLRDTLDPHFIRVIGDFTRRGGISIKPVSAYFAEDCEKETLDQLIEMTDRLNYER